MVARRLKRAETPKAPPESSSGTGQPFLLGAFSTTFLICVIVSTLYYRSSFLPSPAAYPATGVVPLFNATVIITGIAFFVTQILLFYFAWRYRKRDQQLASFIKGSNKLELIWTIVPAVAFVFLFIWGHLLWTKIISPPQGDILEIEVMAEQFNWNVRYAGPDNKMGRTSFRFINTVNSMGVDTSDPDSKDDFIPVQMHIPKNRQVRLTLRSKDVIHSFFIPFFRIKMDAVPGMSTSVHFTAIESTDQMRMQRKDPEFEYEVACAELCGRMHFAMKLILVVDEPSQFNEWYTKQQSWMSKQVETNNEKP